MLEIPGEEYLRITRTLENLSEVTSRLDREVTWLHEQICPSHRFNNDKIDLIHYQQRIGALRESLENARKALGERDQRIKALVQCQVESDEIENTLHNEIAERDEMIRNSDSRIQSLLAEIREKNITIARLQGMVGGVESPDEPGIPCQS
jgi:uncharacterized protein (DUF3084 family)